MMPNLGLTDFLRIPEGGGGILLLDIKHNNEFADHVCVKKEDRRKLSLAD